MLWLQMKARWLWNRIYECLKDDSGIGVVEIILILVVNLIPYFGVGIVCIK